MNYFHRDLLAFLQNYMNMEQSNLVEIASKNIFQFESTMTGPRFRKPSSLFGDFCIRTLQLALLPTNFSLKDKIKIIWGQGEVGGGGGGNCQVAGKVEDWG